jgi:hypothetical protein
MLITKGFTDGTLITRGFGIYKIVKEVLRLISKITNQLLLRSK